MARAVRRAREAGGDGQEQGEVERRAACPSAPSPLAPRLAQRRWRLPRDGGGRGIHERTAALVEGRNAEWQELEPMTRDELHCAS